MVVVLYGAFTASAALADAFETPALLISLILLGKYLEARAKGHTSDALRALVRLAPASAVLVTRLSPDGQASLEEHVIDAALVHRGDVLRVPPGAKVCLGRRRFVGPSSSQLIERRFCRAHCPLRELRIEPIVRRRFVGPSSHIDGSVLSAPVRTLTPR